MTSDRFLVEWLPIDRFNPEAPENEPSYLFYSPELVDKDFNPEGVVEGFWLDETGFVGALWIDEQDRWEMYIIHPTYYMPKPRAPK